MPRIKPNDLPDLAVPTPHHIPDEAIIRVRQLLGNAKAVPPIPGFLPISRSTLYAWMRAGRFPGPTFRSGGVMGWRMGDVRRWLDDHMEPA
jgi:prophage regulatory protein